MTDKPQTTDCWCLACRPTDGEIGLKCKKDKPQTNLEEVGKTSRGYTIFREPNGAGGHRYWSDAIGGGVVVWDTCLVSREELELALKIERDH